MNAKNQYKEIFNLLEKHTEYFNEVIPLIASENITSLAVREALLSDFGHRYAEGWPGERVYAGCTYIDQVEIIADRLAKDIFKAEFVDVRPISGVVANLIAFTAFTDPGDRIIALSIPSGGHISHARRGLGGTAGVVHGLNVQSWEFDEDEFNIDVDKSEKKIRGLEEDGRHIDLMLFGGSLFLFPSPIKQMSEIAKEFDMKIVYDAAHVAGLIGAGLFQDPLREGADCMTMSTHKSLFGPQRGMLASFEKYSEKLKSAAFPGMLSNHHLNTLAGLAIALCEFKAFGKPYAEQVIKNAKYLAQALYEKGFNVVGESKGFTESHQVIVDVINTPLRNGWVVEEELERAGIIANRELLPYDIREGRHFREPGGIRIGTCELTRLGMNEEEMKDIAEFMKRVMIDLEDPLKVKKDVVKFREDWQFIHYCFQENAEAYEYLKIL